MHEEKALILLFAVGLSWWGWRMLRKNVLIDDNEEIDLLARTIWGEARAFLDMLALFPVLFPVVEFHLAPTFRRSI